MAFAFRRAAERVPTTDEKAVAHRDRAAAERRTLFLVAALVASRLVFAAMAPLAFDEAYYWLWSKHLAGGYYDHPPMAAVIIRIGTLLAGNTAFGIRVVSVLLAVPATWAVWRAALILFEGRALAARAALFLNLTLIFAGATAIVTPDAPLIVASCFVLFCLAKVERSGQGVWWLGVGAATGVALASKYSALFFGASIAAWLLVVPRARRWVATPWLWLGGLVALACFAPVLAWNAAHGWVSFLKQFGRAAVHDWTLASLPEFVTGQIGLATPAIFILGAMGLWAFARGRGGPRSARVLVAALVWPFLFYFAWHSLHARVEANWTAPLYPAFAVAAASAARGVAWRGRAARLAAFADRTAVPVGLGLLAAIYLQAIVGVIPLGAADPTARQLGAGWDALGAEIDRERRALGAPAVLTTSYAATGWLSFYLPSRVPVIQVNERIRWANAPEPDPALFAGPLLYACKLPCEGVETVRSRFADMQEIRALQRRRYGVTIEAYRLYRVARPRGDPLERAPPSELAAP